jgi:hypothetical protein
MSELQQESEKINFYISGPRNLIFPLILKEFLDPSKDEDELK